MGGDGGGLRLTRLRKPVWAPAGEVTHCLLWRARAAPRSLRSFGQPRFPKALNNSFEFDCPPRAIYADIVKVGSISSTRAAASWASRVTSEMGEGGRETAVSWQIGGVLTEGLLHCDDGLVKATKLNKGLPDASKRRCSRGSTGLMRMARSKLRIASSGSPAFL